MNWLTENWMWVLFGVAFIAMHFSGYGCHGSHRGGHGASPKKPEEIKPSGQPEKTNIHHEKE